MSLLYEEGEGLIAHHQGAEDDLGVLDDGKFRLLSAAQLGMGEISIGGSAQAPQVL